MDNITFFDLAKQEINTYLEMQNLVISKEKRNLAVEKIAKSLELHLDEVIPRIIDELS